VNGHLHPRSQCEAIFQRALRGFSMKSTFRQKEIFHYRAGNGEQPYPLFPYWEFPSAPYHFGFHVSPFSSYSSQQGLSPAMLALLYNPLGRSRCEYARFCFQIMLDAPPGCLAILD